MLKKVLFCFSVLIGLLSPWSVQALTKDKMQQMEFEPLIELALPDGYLGFQGMVITDKYFVVSAINADSTKTQLLVYDKKTYQKVLVGDTELVYNFGHANDMAYSKEKNEIYIIDNLNIFVLDATTFLQKETKNVSEAFWGIAYDENQKVWYLRTDNNVVKKFDESMKELGTLVMEPNSYSKQGISFHDGFLLYNVYTNATIDEIATENLIYVYDDKSLVNAFYTEKKYGEIEAYEFDEGVPFALFNHGDNKKGVLYKAIFDGVEQAITIKDSEINSSSKAILSDGTKELETVRLMKDTYSFQPILYTRPGNYVYRITKVNEDSSILSNFINVSVSVRYNAAKNKLISTVNYENNQDMFVTASALEENESEEEIENPDTGAFLPMTVMILFAVSGVFFLFNKKKKLYQLQ